MQCVVNNGSPIPRLRRQAFAGCGLVLPHVRLAAGSPSRKVRAEWRPVHRLIKWALSGSHGYHDDRLGVASVLIQDGFAEVLTKRGISVFGERRLSLRLLLISDVGNLRLFEGSPDLEVHTSAAAETALLLGLVAIIAAPFSVMHGAVQFFVHGQARSGGSAHATENPSRSTFGSTFPRPPIWKPTTWACSSPTTSNEASLPRKGMWPTSASDWCSVSARSHCATGTTGSFGARPGRASTLGSTPISRTSSWAGCSARSFPLCRQPLIRTSAARAL